jgi:glycerate dehydrogenase
MNETLHIAALDTATLGPDVDLAPIANLGEFRSFASTVDKEFFDRARGAEVVVVNKVQLDRERIEALDSLKLVCLTATVTNNIDLAAAEERGIAVANVAGYSTESVAQHTFASLFALLQQLSYYDSYVKSGGYANSPMFTHLDRTWYEIHGKRWGIIGLGTIGKRVAELAGAFGCKVGYYSTSGRNTEGGYPRRSLSELLEESRIVSIHAPLNENTRGLIGAQELSQLGSDSVILNLGRGGIIDERALAEAIDKERIRGAAVDVFESEPPKPDNPLLSVKQADRLFLTPHIAWGSIEARRRVVQEVAANIEAFLRGERRNRVA